MKNLCVCVIGLGSMGKLHLQKLMKIGSVDVIAADVDSSRISEIRSAFKIRTDQDYRKVIPDIDAAVVATPTITHYAIVKELLKNGVHVFVEKPIADSAKNAVKICSLAEKRGLILHVGHIEQYNPAYRKAKALVRSPEFIEFSRLSPFPFRSLDVDVIMDVMIHDIGLALDIAGSDVKSVEAFGQIFVSDGIDFVRAKIVFRNGCIAVLTASRAYSEKIRKIYIIDRKRQFLVDLLEKKLSLLLPGKNGIEIGKVRIDPSDQIETELKDFLSALKKQKSPLVTGRDGLKILNVAEKIRDKLVIL